MPEAKKTKSSKKTTPLVAVAITAVVYDKLEIVERSSNSEKGPLFPADWKILLGWETESEYQKRMCSVNPGSKAEQWTFGDDFHCYDRKDNKVRCWNNAGNRPFDKDWCEQIVFMILSGEWAGPHTVQGGTINGETVRISKAGLVLSGAHQGTATILADEDLQASRAEDGNILRPKYPFWNGFEHPFIETILITGLSDDERILRTIDYVKPRSVADMLYTMQFFRSNTPAERRELTRMLAVAAETLWDRTDTQGYKTHPEMVSFIERHRRLLKCVEHLYIENRALITPMVRVFFKDGTEKVVPREQSKIYEKDSAWDRTEPADNKGGRKITALRLSPGQCAALCYLMGSSGDKTDGDTYRNQSPPSEKGLDWSYWDKAQEFWTRLATGRSFIPVRHALGRLLDSTPMNEDNQGLGGRQEEKLAIIAKAWEVWKEYSDETGECPVFTDEDLEEDGALWLTYTNLSAPKITETGTIGGEVLPDGKIRLVDDNDFGGIDCGYRTGRKKETTMPFAPTEEEIAKATEEARSRREKR